MPEKVKKIYRWKTEFARNGWINWFCPYCKRNVWNDDIHVALDWDYCPYCGSRISYEEGDEK